MRIVTIIYITSCYKYNHVSNCANQFQMQETCKLMMVKSKRKQLAQIASNARWYLQGGKKVLRIQYM